MIEGRGLGATGADRAIPTSQPMSVPANTEVLNLDGLCERCLGNLDLVQRVLGKFEQRLPEELAELERVLELGDAAKAALVAHRIKGAASNVLASGLQKAAAEIEDLSRAEQAGGHRRAIDVLARGQWQLYVECRPRVQLLANGGVGSRPAPTHPAATVSEANR